jgi:hypothetical protein
MGAFSNALTAGFREARRVAGTDFVYSSTTYRGIMPDSSSLVDLVSGGFMTDYDAALEYLKADCDPSIGETLTINSVSYRVKDKRSSQENPVGVLALQGVNK